MKKRIKGFKLSRSKNSRTALYRSLVRSFMFNGSLETTYTKAKMIQPRIEKLVQKAKTNDLSTRRNVYADLANNREVTDYLFGVVAKAFEDKKNGFIKFTDLGVRRGDNSRIARIDWAITVPPYTPQKKIVKPQEVKETKKTKK